MRTLEKITIKNFKSIREQTLALGRLNVFIGANGSGKSNLIEIFRFLREILNQNLAGYTSVKGGADNLLHFGRKHSPTMEMFLEFGEDNISNSYKVILEGTTEGSLIVRQETAYYHDKVRYPHKPYDRTIVAVGKESRLRQHDHISARQVAKDLEGYRVYHFHDTSDTAAVKGTCEVEDNRFLRPQADNLAGKEARLPGNYPGYDSPNRPVLRFFPLGTLETQRNEDTSGMERER
jgi:predicted ATPase